MTGWPCWLVIVGLARSSNSWYLWTFHQFSNKTCDSFSLSLCLVLFGGEGFYLVMLFCSLSAAALSASFLFYPIEITWCWLLRWGRDWRFKFWWDWALVGGEISVIHCLLSCCFNVFSKRASSHFLSRCSLKNPRNGIERKKSNDWLRQSVNKTHEPGQAILAMRQNDIYTTLFDYISTKAPFTVFWFVSSFFLLFLIAKHEYFLNRFFPNS